MKGWRKRLLRREVEALRDSLLSFAMRQLPSDTNASTRTSSTSSTSQPEHDASIGSPNYTKRVTELRALR